MEKYMNKLYQICLAGLLLLNSGFVLAQKSDSRLIIKENSAANVLPFEYSKWIEYVKNKNPELNCHHSENKSTCLFISKINLNETQNDIIISIIGESKVNGKIKSLVLLDDENQVIMPKNLTLNGDKAKFSLIKEKRYIDINSGKIEIVVTYDRGDFIRLS